MSCFYSGFYHPRDNSNDDIEDILKRDIEEYKRRKHEQFTDIVSAICGCALGVFIFVCMFVVFLSILKDCH